MGQEAVERKKLPLSNLMQLNKEKYDKAGFTQLKENPDNVGVTGPRPGNPDPVAPIIK